MQGGQGCWKGVIPSIDPNPTVPKEFFLDDVQGHVCTMHRVTIPPFGTINIHGNTDVQGHCMWVHLLAKPAWGPQLPASIILTATYGELHPGSSQVPICLRNLSAHSIVIPTKVVVGSHSSQPGATGGSPDGNHGRIHPWPLERLDPGVIEPSGSRGVVQGGKKSGQEASVQRGTPVCQQWPGPEKNIPNETLDWTHWLDAFQGALPTNTPHIYDDMKAHLQERLDISAIWKSCCPWASAVVLVQKKDRSLRFCINLRKLNHWTIKDAYLLPHINEILNSLQGSQWFSSINLKSGYWQVKMDKESKSLTAFTMGPFGLYKCDRRHFGLTNAPATFQQLMEICLWDLNLNCFIICLDDIVIFSKDLASHLERLEAVFQKLEQAGLKLKPPKCELFCRQITYLGHIVSAHGIVTNEGKIDAIKNWPTPPLSLRARAFLGSWVLLPIYPQVYAGISTPTHVYIWQNAGKKWVAITWKNRFQWFFDDLKCLCTTAPILINANFMKPFKLHTNDCGSGLGAVLYHTHDDGTDAIITYVSRSLTKAEIHYSTHQLEFLALKWVVVKTVHKYLYGSTFDVYTDNKPLTYILMTAKLDAVSHCWVASLANYNFQLYYRAGKTNIDADTLSKVFWLRCVPNTLGAHHQFTAAVVGTM